MPVAGPLTFHPAGIRDTIADDGHFTLCRHDPTGITPPAPRMLSSRSPSETVPVTSG